MYSSRNGNCSRLTFLLLADEAFGHLSVEGLQRLQNFADLNG